MTYVDGVVAAVPKANKDQYLKHATLAAAIFRKHGALSVTECWGNDVPEGKNNSLHTAVMRKDDEEIVFSWIKWPSKEVRDAGWAKIMEDPEMQKHEMPFDGSRMIFGGFDVMMEA
ncbi:DUF1428 domain-containing protein [Parvularcula sp. LCG005]|uniref:DUF1428 domain-containing protein n=1 Tax=Parvularcula sp. LCG005 TaxID=3078805 RepID=UPI002943957B|nr:DUF1428 domain-containing protein [Parvularcula sp. LCG005]WOI52477.1 DUF1428 domain-containing protein [Parvularcula sp. LCG005]